MSLHISPYFTLQTVSAASKVIKYPARESPSLFTSYNTIEFPNNSFEALYASIKRQFPPHDVDSRGVRCSGCRTLATGQVLTEKYFLKIYVSGSVTQNM